MKLLTSLRWSVAQRGLGGTLRAAAAALRRRLRPGKETQTPHPFDLQYGTDTGGLVLGRELAPGFAHSAEITGYAATSPSRFWNTLEHWRAALRGRPVEQYAFVDVGCGKGRVLLLASRWPFREVLGVEIDPALTAVAERNLERWKEHEEGIAPIHLVEGDATEVGLPAGDLLVFLYNPFSPVLMRALLGRLAARQEAEGGALYLIYHRENADNPLRTEVRWELLWRGVPEISAEDRPYDPVVADDDEASIYRWRG